MVVGYRDIFLRVPLVTLQLLSIQVLNGLAYKNVGEASALLGLQSRFGDKPLKF